MKQPTERDFAIQDILYKWINKRENFRLRTEMKDIHAQFRKGTVTKKELGFAIIYLRRARRLITFNPKTGWILVKK